MKSSYLLIMILLISTTAKSMTIYVNSNATGSNTGTDWTNAYTDLQDAITLSGFGDEIWVAQGTYYPGTAQSASFSLKNGTKIYGGFIGSETLLSQRDFETNVTILSGEIGSGSVTDNCKVVVYFSNVSNQTRLDGFIISGGYHSGVSAYGGGAKVIDSSPTIANCKFQGNYAEDGGGALNHSGSGILTLDSCIFDGNVGNTYGGGAVRLYTGTVNISNCYFKSNQSNTYGGAMYIYDAIVNVTNSVFAGNMSQSSGSAIRIGDLGTLHLSNSLVVGNYTNTVGTIVTSTFSNSSSHTLKNCTIAHNKQDNSSGSSTASTVALNDEATVTNSIIYGNMSTIQVLGTGLTFDYNITENVASNATGGNVLYVDPEFVMPGDVNTAPFDTVGLDYHLDLLSEGIDVGLNANVSGSSDLAGNARVYNSTVDLGAYEKVFCVSSEQFTTSSPYTICGGTPITLEVNNGVDYSWSTGSTSNSIGVSSAGTYSVIFKDAGGCRGYLSANITSSPDPTPNITYSMGSLDAGTYSSYQWYFNGGMISGSTNSTHTPIEGYGLYEVSVQNSVGCEGTASYCLSPAALTAGGPTAFCEGGDVNLTVSDGDSYVWSTGALSSSINVTTSGTYSVTVMNTIAGCSVVLEQTVDVYQDPNPSINFDGTNLSTGTFTTYQWNLNGSPISGATSQDFDPTSTGNGQYTVTVTNANGCEAVSNVYELTNLDVENSENFTFAYYPNPVKSGSELILKFGEEAYSQIHVELFNSAGIKVLDKQISNDQNSILLPQLPSGLYYINFIYQGRRISGYKLIVL